MSYDCEYCRCPSATDIKCANCGAPIRSRSALSNMQVHDRLFSAAELLQNLDFPNLQSVGGNLVLPSHMKVFGGYSNFAQQNYPGIG